MALVKHNNNSISNVTSFAQIPAGKPVLLSTATASSSASIEFTSGIDSTYDIYKFEFINIHPATNGANFNFNLSTDNGSNYNVTKTTTHFNAQQNEAGTSSGIFYDTAGDLAQSTADQPLSRGLGNDNDQCVSGTLHIFNPASTTFVKHFIFTLNHYNNSDLTVNNFIAGYGNTTSSIKFSSGNLDFGTIKMYGISA
jgi:hypothetical protein